MIRCHHIQLNSHPLRVINDNLRRLPLGRDPTERYRRVSDGSCGNTPPVPQGFLSPFHTPFRTSVLHRGVVERRASLREGPDTRMLQVHGAIFGRNSLICELSNF